MSGVKQQNDEQIVKELEYFVNCNSCYTITGYFKDGLLDKMN